MIKKIAHISDVHIRKNPNRNEEYYSIFNDLFESLKQEKPDRIAIAGDFNNDYIEMEGEQLILASYFLRNLSLIAPVIVIRGNHDVRKGNLKRVDSIKAIVESLQLNNVQYYDSTNFYDDENVTWAVWNYGDKKMSPWKLQQKNYNKENIVIDLFHEEVGGAINVHGHELKGASKIGVSDFKGDLSFFGHIHKKQYLDKKKTKAYAGSLIAQKIDEGDDEFHGYLLWDIETKKAKEIEIVNKYVKFVNVTVNVFTDFDDLDIDIPYEANELNVRVIWNTLPGTKNKINEAKVKLYLENKYPNITTITSKKQFVEEDKIEVIDEIENGLILNQDVQEQKFRDYLGNIGVEEDIIEGVIELDRKIANSINIEELTNTEWSIIKVWGKNFMSYDDFYLDFRDKEGLIQIVGKNGGGKTTIFKTISYVAYGQTLETENNKKFGDSRFINNKTGIDSTSGGFVICANNVYYGIQRSTKIERNKVGEIKGSPTKVTFHLLSSPDDIFDETNDINNLSDENRRKTQNELNRIIGSYDNFKRIVITTSDTLNASLSSIKSEFIDSLLHDAGLDVFDKKLEEFKKQDKENVKMLVNCDVEKSKEKIKEIDALNIIVNNDIKIKEQEIECTKQSIVKGGKYVQSLSSKLYQIDPEIYSMNLDVVNNEKHIKETELNDLFNVESELNEKIKGLAETFDTDRYTNLVSERDSIKDKINNIKIEIKNIETANLTEQHKIEIINGEIFRLTNTGNEKKESYLNLKSAVESKSEITCPTCGQIVGKDNIEHIKNEMDKLKSEMHDLANQILQKKTNEIPPIQQIISNNKENVILLNSQITTLELNTESILKEIGELVNIKNDVEKRNELVVKLNEIPLKRENINLNINLIENKITNYNNLQIQIEENKKTNVVITQANQKLNGYNNILINQINELNTLKNTLSQNELNIVQTNDLIKRYIAQQKEEAINTYYKKCIHRDGIPKQMLTTQIIPKINKEIEIILDNSDITVWLDNEELTLKMCYNQHPDAIIDAISSSGMERTFTSIPYKIALNKINAKSKPNFILLDEIMGKLDSECVVKFTQLLNVVKKSMKHIFIVEHNHEVEPDYIISVNKNNNGISTCEFID